LDVIACRHQGSIEGRVLLGKKELDASTFKRKCGYVIQSDRLLANLTVKETLMYTALKFGVSESSSATANRVRMN
jgi:ATP-binding cassette subfamily G (WHITE) protein 5 (sterolin 1)